MISFCDAFISYGRADSLAFGIKLSDRLLAEGFKIWFDQNDIPLGVDFQNQIDDGIEKSHNFLFIIAPHSVNSPYCLKEIELAIKRNKRIIPLLHVEQITQETWQQRFPKGTDKEWEAYKANGKHTVFQNMHPTIGKINWVYFREGIDDFEKSFAGLIGLLKRHADYVEQHTRFLVKALEWERHQKSHSCLLIGDEKQEAQDWLKRRFKDEQPPCIPTDLHCEYITESIKNANNLMTQVIISYADEDRAAMEKIRNSLRRESITVWTNRTDIQTGEAFEEAIKRGIEQADNVVYLLSPDSVKSYFARQELEYALSHNKRIIPILVRETSSEPIPNALRDLQYIDLTDNVKEEDYHLDESQLLRILHQDEAYYNEHKVLLTKALKWKRQHENPSILLRGYNLRSAETWLKVANKRTQHPPTPLMEEFINESLLQPPATSLDVFISYSRADSDFARKLNNELQLQGKRTWFDQESIASGTDFAQEIKQGIQACDNFLFILSPRSVNSLYCADEVEYAAQLNKRFVTLLHRQVNSDELHPELAKVQWIDFNQNERDFNVNFRQLVRTLDTDREHLRHHTKWSQRAIEWDSKDRSADLLLRGSEFAIAQNWLQETEQQKKKPAATLLQKEFIEASKNAIAAAEEDEKRRQAEMLRLQEERTREAEARLAEKKKSLFFVWGLFGVAVLVSVVAWGEKQKAEEILLAQVNALSRYSKSLSNSNQEFDALIEGIRAGNSLLQQRNELFNFWRKNAEQSRHQVEEALQKAINGVQELNRIEGQTEIHLSPDNRTIVTINQNMKMRLWDFQGKNQLLGSNDGKKITDEKITDNYSIYFTEDGNTIATVSGEGNKRTIKLWNNQGKLIQSFSPIEKFDYMYFTPNDKLIYTSSREGDKWTAKLWKIEGKQLKPMLSGEKINSVSFSKDGNTITTFSRDGDKQTFKLWNIQGQLIQSIPSIAKFDYIGFSSNDKLLYSVSTEGDKRTVKFWKIEGKQLKPMLSGEKFNDFSFSQDDNTIATVSEEGDKWTIKLWNSQGQLIQSFNPIEKFDHMYLAPNNKLIYTGNWKENRTSKLWKIEDGKLKSMLADEKFNNVSFSKDGNRIATVSNNIIKLWTQDGEELKTLRLGTGVEMVHFSSENKNIATVSSDKTVNFWNIDSSDRQILKGEDAEFNKVQTSPKDSKLVVTTYSEKEDNRTAKLWIIDGKQPQPLLSNETFNQVSFSNDRKLIATYSGKEDNQTVQLWSVEGKPLQSLSFNQKFNRVDFSDDSKLIATYSGEGDRQTAKLWSVEGKQLQPLLLNETFNRISFSDDGKLIATYSGEGDKRTAKLWRVEGKQLQPLLLNETFNGVSFSDDGKLIATFSKSSDNQKVNRASSDNPTVKLWTHDGKGLASFPTDEKIESLQFSPDGKLIATFNWSNSTVKFWKLAQDKLKPLQEVRIDIYSSSVGFSLDGKLIATVDHKKVIQLWNRDGKELAHLDFDFNESIKDMSFSPDSKILAISSKNKAPILWYLKRDEWERQSKAGLEQLVNQACEKVGNYLKNSAPESDRTLCDGISQK